MNLLWNFVIFWGVWLLVPLVIDGIGALSTLASVLWMRLRRQPIKPLKYHPMVTVIVPIYNSARTLETCLQSLQKQSYPPSRIEIFLIDNGSTDNSYQVFLDLHTKLQLNINWLSVMNQGKSWALNAGIYVAKGDIVINVDSDVALDEDAVKNVVAYMNQHPKVGALTSAIYILPPFQDDPWLTQMLGRCEFLEYLTAYHVGRVQQTLMSNVYTLSGAFTALRKEVIYKTHLYDQRTVTEDTDMTFHLYDKHAQWSIACDTRVIAYTDPIESLQALYAQRVRWQRGQLEVSARYSNTLMKRPIWQLFGLSPSRVLLVDHTLSFIRLIWTFFLPALVMFNYSPSFIVMAFLFIYLFYLIIDILWMMASWLDAGDYAKQRLRQEFLVVLVMPLYRMLVFYFRLSGFLHAVAEPGAWRVQDPVAQTRAGASQVRQAVRARAERHFSFLRKRKH